MSKSKKKPTDPAPKKKINSKKKGGAGEREVVDLFKKYGYLARRSQQFCGKSGDASDVILPEFPEAHVEVKRTETISIYKVLEQVVADNKHLKPLELIFHRRNQQDWVCIMPEKTFFTLLKGYQMTQEKLTTAQRSQKAKERKRLEEVVEDSEIEKDSEEVVDEDSDEVVDLSKDEVLENE